MSVVVSLLSVVVSLCGALVLKKLQMLHFPIMVFFISIVLFDLMAIILLTQNYYFAFLKPTSFIIPSILTLLALFLVLIDLKPARFWALIITVLVMPLLIPFAFIHLFVDLSNSYETVTSPDGKNILIIEHRDATLGETNHFYNIYMKKPLGLMKKLNDETIHIMTRGTNDSNLEVLGIDNTEWVEDNYVIFRSSYGETKVEFNY
ncbi:hypothetical protein [Oceanobacillus kapialis]|uniref:Uncharacterized protein n=1 Tax=Oceanobacillus kapialis TaxID=481353 RepID=A0ABW5Q1P8_9BACI